MKILAFVFALFAARAVTAAPIMLVDFADQPVDFASVQKDVTVLAFWKSTCAPCIEEMPLLNALCEKIKNDPTVAVIGINTDTEDDVKAARRVMAAHPVSYPMLRDDKRALAAQWVGAVYPLPMLLVVDRKMNAQKTVGFRFGGSAEDFVKGRLAQIETVRAGKLHAHVEEQRVVEGGVAESIDGMADIFEKLVHEHYPKLSHAEVKKRVAKAMKKWKPGAPLDIE
jgi:thiol-disulfide isomerase/thioredoxin